MKDSVQDKIRGCMVGGAVGDALGYAVEFLGEEQIFSAYGEKGITEYDPDESGQALISDDTQMTLFTADALLVGDTRGCMRGIGARPSNYVEMAYQDWLLTQVFSYEYGREMPPPYDNMGISWLLDVPELYSRRAPGNTCLSGIKLRRYYRSNDKSYIKKPLNDSKGCGGVMRVAPLALNYRLSELPEKDIKELDLEGAEIAAITHGHSLGYMPAAVLVHIVSRIVYPEGGEARSLKEIVLEARDTAAEIFNGDKHLRELTDIIDLAVELSENGEKDLDNIHLLGEGWVAEETLAIAIYCALRHQKDFSAGVIAAVNHRGDSDSTGAVTGNILGALLGFEAIEDKWKKNLELIGVIIEMADDIFNGCQTDESGRNLKDPDWARKYVSMRWKDAPCADPPLSPE